MKKLAKSSLVTVLAFFLIGGCATQDVQTYATPANARIATALVCSNTLTFAVKDADRIEVANYLYSIAHGIRTLTTGQVPTPAELQATINLFSPGSGAKWATLGTSIGAIYGGVFAQIHGEPKLCIDYLNAIAAGCEDAVAPYVTHPSPTPAS
jgi:hypothetical protein